ncbi:hypothetical protein L2D14_02340 [Thalassospiraceae bacterium LMO-JJ14]|nr:hypothetical protein L2D14_02340 [Thalassospiraceae bacterium LMO-JJ14]
MTMNRLYLTAFWGSAASMAVLMAVRLYNGVSFDVPLQFITSGDEQASLYAIWKSVHGVDVYTDPSRSPYAMSFYNALFYVVYGTWSWFWLSLLSLADTWLPTVSRFLTLLGAVAGWALAACLLMTAGRQAQAAEDQQPRFVAALSAALLFIGPLMGFWAFTVRPDLWAFVFEIIAVLVFIRTYAENRQLAVTLAAALLFGSWMFKQAAISAVCGIGLFLLFEREWRALFLFCAVYLGSCFAAIFAGGELYRQSIFFTQIALEYSLMHGIKVWANAVAKTLPIYLPLLVIVYALVTQPAYRRQFMNRWVCRFFLYGFIASAGIIFALSVQDASAENYTFTPGLFAAGLLVSGFACMEKPSSGRLALARAWLAAMAMHALLCVLVIGGVLGVLDPARKSHSELTAAAECINRYPGPLFVEDTYLSLPWMTQSAEPFVLSYTYGRARALGIPHEKDGIGGRIDNGEFTTLALSTDNGERGFDGAHLRHYRLLPKTCGSLHMWSRIDP